MHPRKLAADLWSAHRYRIQPEVDPAMLDADEDEDVAYWKQIQAV